MPCNSLLFRPMQFLFQNSTSVHLSDINKYNFFIQHFQAIHVNFQLLQYYRSAFITMHFSSQFLYVQLPILLILHVNFQVFQQCSHCIFSFQAIFLIVLYFQQCFAIHFSFQYSHTSSEENAIFYFCVPDVQSTFAH